MNTSNTIKYDNPHVRETSKSSDILDNFGNLRFQVSLTDQPDNNGSTSFMPKYYVYVKSYWQVKTPDIIVSRDFDSYDVAVQFYQDSVKRYAYLVQAETRDVQDIRVYAGRTGYHKICPDCCASCRWAKPCDKDNCLFDDWRKDFRGKFLCMNSKLYSDPRKNLDADFKPDDKCHCRSNCHVADIHPIVDANGICNGFERNFDEKYRDPSHSHYRFRTQDMNAENKCETVANYVFNQQFVNQKSDILREVGTAIECQLRHNVPIIDGNRENGFVINGNDI